MQDNLAMKLLPVGHDINANNLPEKWQKTMNDAIYGTDNRQAAQEMGACYEQLQGFWMKLIVITINGKERKNLLDAVCHLINFKVGSRGGTS